MEIKLEFPKGRDFERVFMEMDKKVSIKILRDAGSLAMEPVLADAQLHAGYDETGDGPHMRDNLKIRTADQMKKGKYPTAVSVRVGISKAHHIKAWAQEMGTRKQAPKPFLRPALDYNKEKVLKILSIQLREALESK